MIRFFSTLKKKSCFVLFFDDINYYKYKSIGPNRLLADSLKENAKAFKYYRNHRITKLTGFISANAFVVPLLIGLLKYNDERAKPFIIMSASGMLASVCITVSIPKDYSIKLLHVIIRNRVTKSENRSNLHSCYMTGFQNTSTRFLPLSLAR